MNIRRSILTRINTYRTARDLSRSGFCRLVGVDHKVVQILESGESVTLGTLEKIELFLDCHAETLPQSCRPVTGTAAPDVPAATLDGGAGV